MNYSRGSKINRETGERIPVAMKVIGGGGKKDAAKQKKMFLRHRWRTEYKVMTTFEHPNLVKVSNSPSFSVNC